MGEDRKESTKVSKAHGVLAGFIAFGFFATLTALACVSFPDSNTEALMLMIGALISSFSTVVGFYYGSSMSSNKKDETIHTLTKNGGSQ